MDRLESEYSMDETAARTGVHISRRSVLRGSAASAMSVLLGGLVAGKALANGNQNADGFFERWQELATGLLENNELNEEEYIYELAKMASQTERRSFPRRKEIAFEGGGMSTGMAWKLGAIFAIELRLEPGAVVRPHNHPSHNSVILGMEGSCHYAHYEPGDSPPPAKEGSPSFLVQQTRSGLLLPGRISELTKERDNIHTFVAGDEGATFLDFSTEVGGGTTSFSVLEIDSKPADERKQLFEAKWVGNPYR